MDGNAYDVMAVWILMYVMSKCIWFDSSFDDFVYVSMDDNTYYVYILAVTQTHVLIVTTIYTFCDLYVIVGCDL